MANKTDGNGNGTPLGAKGKAFAGWNKVFEAPRVELRRKDLIIGVLGVSVAILALTIMRMAPLKEMKPYFIESDPNSGAVVISSRVAHEYKPTQDNAIYFLKLFVRDAITIDSTLTPNMYFPEAFAFTRGNAVGQLKQYITDNKVLDKIANDPNFKRDPKVLSLPTFLSDGVALVRYTTSDTNKRYAMTVHYTFIVPDSEEERLKNPLGFYITDFVINEEI